MKKRILWSLGAFAAVMVLHASVSILEGKRLAERWAGTSETNYLGLYFQHSEYLIGASYALAIGFSVYALLRFLENRKTGLAGLVGSITFTGALYVAGCFLLGCCGSPMLAVYLTLFGSSVLGFTKLLTFALTCVSIVIGFVWVERKSGQPADCCEGDAEWKPK